MKKIELDDLAIITFKNDPQNSQRPSNELRRWLDVKERILEALRSRGYSDAFTSEDGHSAWILEPAQSWQRGRVRISVEVLIEEDEQSPQAPGSPLDDIRNLSDADSCTKTS
ncbi:MAG: hypothetical protein Fur0042_14740 [Cyanophyceae cyanobacterium]